MRAMGLHAVGKSLIADELLFRGKADASVLFFPGEEGQLHFSRHHGSANI